MGQTCVPGGRQGGNASGHFPANQITSNRVTLTDRLVHAWGRLSANIRDSAYRGLTSNSYNKLTHAFKFLSLVAELETKSALKIRPALSLRVSAYLQGLVNTASRKSLKSTPSTLSS